MKVKGELFSMKTLILVSFFFIICGNALSSSSSESTLISKAGDYKHLAKDYKQIIKNGHGSKVMRSNEVDENKSKALKGLHEVINLRTKVSSIGMSSQSKKANKGGVYGGGDLVRPRNKKGGASTISLKSSSSMAIKTLALGLLFYVFF